MKQFEEKTIRTTDIFSGKIISVQVDDIQLPNGKEAKRELVKHPGAVAVIALTNEGEMIFVKQYRKPLERTLIEIPAGKIEPNEEPYVTAVRELEEETGFTTDDLQFVTSFATSPGFADEIIHLYFTDNLIQLDNPPPGDEDEFVELITMPLTEAIEALENNHLFDVKTMFAIQYLQIKGLK